jgi:hypothetical protein
MSAVLPPDAADEDRSPVPPGLPLRARVACWFYAARGRCRFGAACRYSHDDAAAASGGPGPGTPPAPGTPK